MLKMPAYWVRAAAGVGQLGRVVTLLIVACVRELPYLPVAWVGQGVVPLCERTLEGFSRLVAITPC